MYMIERIYIASQSTPRVDLLSICTRQELMEINIYSDSIHLGISIYLAECIEKVL